MWGSFWAKKSALRYITSASCTVYVGSAQFIEQKINNGGMLMPSPPHIVLQSWGHTGLYGTALRKTRRLFSWCTIVGNWPDLFLEKHFACLELFYSGHRHRVLKVSTDRAKRSFILLFIIPVHHQGLTECMRKRLLWVCEGDEWGLMLIYFYVSTLHVTCHIVNSI